MRLSVVVSILLIACQADPTRADEPKYKLIDIETITAYEKLGGRYGALSECELGKFSSGRIMPEGVPGFCFLPHLTKGKVPKLPPVKVPFGLYFCGDYVTDLGLKELVPVHGLIRGVLV